MGDQALKATLRTRSAEELIVMEVITVARMKNGMMLDCKIWPIYSILDLLQR